MVYAASLQRVQEPTNLQIRRLSAITRKAMQYPKRIVFSKMKPSGEIDMRSDSGHRKLTGDEGDDTKGHGIRGASFLRRGRAAGGKPVVHLCDFMCDSHRLHVRSSYAAEALAAARNLDECYPTLVTLREMTSGVLAPALLKQLRE